MGRHVARALRTRVASDVRVVEHDGEATALLSEFQSAQHVWLIDAAQSGAAPGTVHRIDCSLADPTLPTGTVSSHGFGLAEAIALARELDMLPRQCVVYAIEGADFSAGVAMSCEVMKAANTVVERMIAEIQAAEFSAFGHRAFDRHGRPGHRHRAQLNGCPGNQ